MKDERRRKVELIKELVRLRKRVARLEKEKAGRKTRGDLARKEKPRVSSFYENLALGYQSLDEKGCFLDVNQTWLDMLGYSREEVIGRWFGDFMAPGYRSSFQDNFQFFKATGEIEDIEFEIVRKDGTRLFVAYDGRVEYGGQRNVKQTHCLMKNITKRKGLEETLLKSEASYKELADSIADIFFAMDHDLKYTYWNKASEKLTGISEKEVIGRSLYDIFPAIKGHQAEKLYKRVLKTQRSQRLTDNFKLGDKDWVFEINAYPSKKGVSVFVKDITERKREEEATRESEMRFHSLVESSSDHIFLLDQNGNYLFSNNRVDQFRVEGGESLIGQNLRDVYPPEIAEFYQQQLEKVFKTGQSVDFEHPMAIADDQHFHLDTLYPIYRDEKIWAVGGICRDITERKRAEERLRISTEQQRSLSARLQDIREEERTAIAREIHDELGQELTGLKMDLSWLLRKVPQEGELIDKAQSMLKLIDSSIQTVRKISTELRPGILDDLGLIAAIEWQANEFENRRGIPCQFDSSLEDIELDRVCSTAIFRIVQETLTNVARHASATKVNISVDKEDENLLVRIEDNGRGITEREVANPKSLGLLGVKERAYVFGGEVKVEGEPGKGTKVMVRIPLPNAEYSNE